MTQKELLYLEDAIGHENNLIKICNNMIEALESQDLKKFMKGQLKKHETLKQKLMNLLGDEADE